MRHYLVSRNDYTTLKKITFAIGNSAGTVTAIFIILTMAGRGTSRDWGLVAMVIGGLLGYEMLNLAGNHPFDVNDVYATLIFGVASALAYACVLARYAKPTG